VIDQAMCIRLEPAAAKRLAVEMRFVAAVDGKIRQ